MRTRRAAARDALVQAPCETDARIVAVEESIVGVPWTTMSALAWAARNTTEQPRRRMPRPPAPLWRVSAPRGSTRASHQQLAGLLRAVYHPHGTLAHTADRYADLIEQYAASGHHGPAFVREWVPASAMFAHDTCAQWCSGDGATPADVLPLVEASRARLAALLGSGNAAAGSGDDASAPSLAAQARRQQRRIQQQQHQQQQQQQQQQQGQEREQEQERERRQRRPAGVGDRANALRIAWCRHAWNVFALRDALALELAVAPAADDDVSLPAASETQPVTRDAACQTDDGERGRAVDRRPGAAGPALGAWPLRAASLVGAILARLCEVLRASKRADPARFLAQHLLHGARLPAPLRMALRLVVLPDAVARAASTYVAWAAALAIQRRLATVATVWPLMDAALHAWLARR